jgi:periplasmic protein TonB
MSLFITNQQKVNDVIFADRNKKYGAYALRSNYGITIFKSLGIVIVTALSISGGLYLTSHSINELPGTGISNILPQEEIIFVDNTKVHEVPAPKAPETELKTKVTPESSASQVLAKQVKDSIPEQKVVATTIVPVEGKASPEAGVSNPTGGEVGRYGKEVLGTTSATNTSTEPASPFDLESEAEYEGGLKALHGFIASKIKYPESARVSNQSGIIYVRFVVDQSGKVGSVTLLNNLGFGLDEEAARVVGLIPPFKQAAKVKGKSVKSYYQLKIRFALER